MFRDAACYAALSVSNGPVRNMHGHRADVSRESKVGSWNPHSLGAGSKCAISAKVVRPA
jgi:hypothetical protein